MMEIVIKIDEDTYKDLTQTGENTIHLGALLNLREAVRNGAPQEPKTDMCCQCSDAENM